MQIKCLTILIFLSAVIAIFYKYKNSIKKYGFFKGLTTSLIIVLAIIIYNEQQTMYSLLILISLVFALIGDLFLIGEKYFLFGLIAFLIAHIGFTIAFTSLSFPNLRNLVNFIPLLILLLISGVYYNYLKKDLHKYTLAVAVYLVVIAIMNWQAILLALDNLKIHFLGIAIASLFFSFSDSVIAYNKFKKPFKMAEGLILSTYWVAIYVFVIAGLFL